MTTVHRTETGIVSYTKGAPDVILERCSRYLSGGGERPLTGSSRRRLQDRISWLSSQGLRVLGTILQGAPFSTQNAVSLRRAAVCSFCIAGAALLRTIWGLWFYQSLRPLATYNALFVPIFTMFGLLCLVMSALFRQATEMKAENDLTI